MAMGGDGCDAGSGATHSDSSRTTSSSPSSAKDRAFRRTDGRGWGACCLCCSCAALCKVRKKGIKRRTVLIKGLSRDVVTPANTSHETEVGTTSSAPKLQTTNI